MFEETIRQLKDLEGTHKISVPIEADEEGYLDKECPSEDCLFQFKVHADDWANLFKDEAVFCPLCRHEANSNSWLTTEQIDHAKEQAGKQIEGIIDESLRKDARRFNRNRHRDSFFQISLEVNGVRKRRTMIPATAKEAMELKIMCDKCGARFSVIGSAFFCPCCGHNSVERTFDDSIKKVRVKLDNIKVIMNALEEIGKKDEAEITRRSLIETSLSDCIVTFQRLAEQLFSKIPNAPVAPLNVFQRIDNGNKLWQTVCGKSYEDWLTTEELKDLKVLFQKRHLLLHTEGIVDQRYLDRSGDESYNIGQRIVVKEDDVQYLSNLIEKLANGIREASSNA